MHQRDSSSVAIAPFGVGKMLPVGVVSYRIGETSSHPLCVQPGVEKVYKIIRSEHLFIYFFFRKFETNIDCNTAINRMNLDPSEQYSIYIPLFTNASPYTNDACLSPDQRDYPPSTGDGYLRLTQLHMCTTF